MRTSRFVGYCDCCASGQLRVMSHSAASGTYRGKDLVGLQCTMLYNSSGKGFGILPSVWGKVLRRELAIQHMLGVDARIRVGEDVTSVYPMILGADVVVVCNEVRGYNYNLTDGSLMDRFDEDYLFRLSLVALRKRGCSWSGVSLAG